MVKGFAIHNAPTDHGGIIPATQQRTSQMGNLFVRAGDGHYCPKCKCWSTVQPSHYHIIMDGRPVAYVDDLLSCGARILPQQSHVVGTSQGENYKRAKKSDVQSLNFKKNLTKRSVDDIEKRKCPSECVVETVSFDTTPGPYIISMEMWKKILEFEKYVAIPYQPGDDNSGVTIAIGYDLGQQSVSQINNDLTPFYTKPQIERLLKAQGKKGTAAKTMIPQLSDITITKDNALKLATVLKTRYADQVISIYPEALNLHPHCQGVLLSLVFNRGPSLKDPKEGVTRIHMRQIRDTLKENTPEKIPDILRDMSKLWNRTGPKGNSGVGKRRREEADIFEKGIKCDCYE